MGEAEVSLFTALFVVYLVGQKSKMLILSEHVNKTEERWNVNMNKCEQLHRK